MSRFRSDEGAYAILYGLLVVVLIGMTSIVVDLGMLRADKRDARTASDNASLAGALELGYGPWAPRQACQKAWQYAFQSLNMPVPATDPCSGFPVSVDLPCPSTVTTVSGKSDDNKVTVSLTWPVPSDSSALLNPDGLASGDSRTYDAAYDGRAAGCERLAVSVARQRGLGLAAALGVTSGVSNGRSVALYHVDEGNKGEVNALNVLEQHDCEDLLPTGGGQIIVGPVTSYTTVPGTQTVVGPGRVAVESDANPSGPGCNGAGTYVIDSSGGGTVCASSVLVTSTVPCDGKGIIASFALGTPQFGKAYNPATNIRPTPIILPATHSWSPVTNLYGCNVTRLPCTTAAGPSFTPPTTNYIAALETAYGGTGAPLSVYSASASPYSVGPPYSTVPFVPVPTSICTTGGSSVSITTTITLAVGNWYSPCSITIGNGGTLVIKGGTLVSDGGIDIGGGSSPGCFVMNVDFSGCPTAANIVGTGALQTTSPAPARDAQVFLRGGSISDSGSLVMPETFVYSKGTSSAPLRVQAPTGAVTLWTAPGAGARDSGTNRTTLEQLCYDSTQQAVVDLCLQSRFSKLAYWSDFAAPSSPAVQSNSFQGQGSLNVVGVFFTPKAYFNFTGGSCYTAAAAQFWARQVNVNGSSCLLLSPDDALAGKTPETGVSLIR